MEIKDISFDEEKLREIGIPEKPWNTSVENVGKDKLNALKTAMKEIKELIEEREELSKKLFDEAERIKMDISNFLAENKPIDVDGLKEKIALKQKQVDISELQLNEKINCWRDVATLKKELREREQELSEKQGRLDVLDKILEE